MPAPRVFVLGRVGADLYPLQLNTPLEEIRTFERFVGGFAGNVATGLARLGVHAAILSAVGDDGHGRFIRTFLAAEGVDVTWLRVHPTLRTALAFCEAWPPDRFPITFYRTPTCPDWELQPHDLPLEALGEAGLLYVSGTGFARDPSRTTTFAAMARRPRPAGASLLPATILDLDWREQLWDDPAAYAAQIQQAAGAATVLLGSTSEFAAARLEPDAALSLGPRLVVLKRGADGAAVIDRAGRVEVPGLPVPVVNGLGAGDAFAAAFGAGLLTGLTPRQAIARANAAGAIVAARLSCSTAMPRPWEIDALLAGGRVVDGEVVAGAAG
ncbi:MAG: PfkB family carbohydrate kinase [Armatimonadota bacterium]|nr:PfkB family carbohydrate kinase [Armatimonadota bacterium]MDR7537606.1 PfkB family carbohydrate kinase [Armatimonadota bacterium]